MQFFAVSILGGQLGRAAVEFSLSIVFSSAATAAFVSQAAAALVPVSCRSFGSGRSRARFVGSSAALVMVVSSVAPSPSLFFGGFGECVADSPL